MARSKLQKGDLRLTLLKVSEGVRYEEKSGEIVLYGLKEGSHITVGIKEFHDALRELEEEQKTIIPMSPKQARRKIEEIRQKERELRDYYSDVIFVENLVGNGLKATGEDGIGLAGEVSKCLRVEPFLSGGGKFYMEAFHKGRQPRLTVPYGIFFSARGPEKVIRTVWTDCSFNIINEPFKFGSSVLLHVYTENLYGQELDVELWDKDWFILDSDDPLHDKGEDGKLFLSREGEVNLHKYEASVDGGGGTSSGRLVNTGKSTSEKIVTTPYVQKGTWLVTVHDTWRVTAGKSLKIYPLVKDKRGVYFKDFGRDYLQVEAGATKYCPAPPTGRSPVKVGQVSTNLGAFKPCFYTYIKAKVDDLPEIVLFSENDSTSLSDEFTLPLTAGVAHAQAKLRLELNTDTSNCLFETTSPGQIHEGKVIDLSRFPVFAPFGKVSGDFIKWDTEEPLSEGSPSKWKAKEPKDKEKYTIKGPSGRELKISQELRNLAHPAQFIVHAVDNYVALYVGYDYSQWGTQHPLIGLAKAIWPNNSHIAQRYPIKIRTCRYPSKTVHVDVYPDVKWTLQLGFNYDAQQFEKIKKEYSENWQLAGESYTSKSRRKDLGREEKARFRKEAEKAMENSKKNIAPASLNTRTAMAGDIVKFQVGMVAEFDGDATKIEASDLFPELTGFLKKVFGIIQKVDEIIDGSDKQAEKEGELVMHPQRMEKLKARVEAKKRARKGPARSVSFAFIPPEIALSFSWQAERPRDVDKPQMGTTFTGKIAANPLLGYKMKLDVIDLLGQAVPHPAIKAAVMFLQFLDKVAGDKFDITFDLTVKGEVKLEGEGQVSTLGNSHVGSKSPFKLEGEITIEIYAEIKLQGSTETLFYGEVGAYGELSGKVTTGITFTGAIEAQKEGLFLVPKIKFHGIVLKGKVKAGIVVIKRDSDESDDKMNLEKEEGLHVGGELEVTAMKAYEWEIKEWTVPLIRNK